MMIQVQEGGVLALIVMWPENSGNEKPQNLDENNEGLPKLVCD